MERAVARLGRDNHINLLISRLPILTTIYGFQCFIVYQIVEGVNIGDFAMYMGLALVSLVSSLFVYDRYHHVLLYQDHLLLYFEPLRMTQKINYCDIKEIIAPHEECDFASIMIRLRNDEVVSIYFVDFPVQVKQVIDELIAISKSKMSEKMAA